MSKIFQPTVLKYYVKKKKKINTSNFQIKVNIQKQLQLIRQPNFGLHLKTILDTML